MADTNKITDVIRTADVVLLGEQDKYVLLIERGWPPYEGLWALPGGHVDPEDANEQAAACRELAEETGVRIDQRELQLVGTYAEPGRDPRGLYKTWAWRTSLGHLPQPRAGTDARTARWWPVADALAQPEQLAFDHHQILTDAIAQASGGRTRP
jgi:8-oxo-dGTP diphosphatase